MIGEAKWTRQIDQLTVFTYASNDALGMAAAQDASVILKEALAQRGLNVIAAMRGEKPLAQVNPEVPVKKVV